MHAQYAFHCHRFRSCRTLMLALSLSLAPGLAAPAWADPAWPRAKFDYVAQRQDLRQVLRDFARAMQVQLELADDVEGSVTGRFDMAPPVLLDMLGSFHQFIWHFDGAVLYVSSSKNGAAKMRVRTAAAAKPAAAPAAAPTAATATTTAPVSAPPPPPARVWQVRLEDATLSTTFARWAKEAGWQLLWELPVDFRVDAGTQVEGEFEHAVTTVANSLAGAATPMQVVLYRGNHVIRVTSKETP